MRSFSLRWSMPILLLASSMPLTSAQAATATGTLNVSAVVPDFCELSSTSVNLSLGNYYPNAETTQSTTIQVRCTIGTAYNVGLGLGTNASGATRRMKHSAEATFLSYELYQSNGSTVWAAPGQAGVVNGTGSGVAQNLTVVGKIPSAQWGISKGSYSDQVVITVTFPDP